MGICKRARWPRQPGPMARPSGPAQPRAGATSARLHAPHQRPRRVTCRCHVSLAPQPTPAAPPSHMQAPSQPGPAAHPGSPPPATCRPHLSTSRPLASECPGWAGAGPTAQGKCGASSRAGVSSPRTHPGLWSVRNQAPPQGGEWQVQPKPTPHPILGPWKNCLSRNWFLVPKRLGSRESLHAKIWEEKTISLDR